MDFKITFSISMKTDIGNFIGIALDLQAALNMEILTILMIAFHKYRIFPIYLIHLQLIFRCFMVFIIEIFHLSLMNPSKSDQ